jgi:hypothetical protein
MTVSMEGYCLIQIFPSPNEVKTNLEGIRFSIARSGATKLTNSALHWSSRAGLLKRDAVP